MVREILLRTPLSSKPATDPYVKMISPPAAMA